MGTKKTKKATPKATRRATTKYVIMHRELQDNGKHAWVEKWPGTSWDYFEEAWEHMRKHLGSETYTVVPLGSVLNGKREATKESNTCPACGYKAS